MNGSSDHRRSFHFFAAFAVAAMLMAAGPALRIVTPVEAATTCIKMPCAGAKGAAKTSAGAAEELPSGAPDFSGELRMSYSPIMCFKAPCPPGSYQVRSLASDRGEFSRKVQAIVLHPANGGASETFRGRYIGGRGLSVEGDIWVEETVAHVLVRAKIGD